MKLYELSQQFSQLLDYIEDGDIEIEQIQDTLESFEVSIEEKFENIAKMIKSLNGDIESFKAEEERLKTRRKVMENRVKWLKEYMLMNLDIMKKDKIEVNTFKIRKQKNPVGVNILDKSKLPKNYLIDQEPVEDKKAILKALKDGEKVEGAQLSEPTYHIRIQ